MFRSLLQKKPVVVAPDWMQQGNNTLIKLQYNNVELIVKKLRFLENLELGTSFIFSLQSQLLYDFIKVSSLYYGNLFDG